MNITIDSSKFIAMLFLAVPCALGGAIISMLYGYFWGDGMFIGLITGIVIALVLSMKIAGIEWKKQEKEK